MGTIVTQEASLAWSGVCLARLKEQCQRLFEALVRVPRVQGACVSDNHGAVLGMLLAEVGDRRSFERLGLAVLQCFAATQPRSAIRDLEATFDRKTILARDLGNALVTVVCGADANLPLLRMTLNVAAGPFAEDDELQRGLKHAALSRANTLSGDQTDAASRTLLQRAGARVA